MDAIGERRVIDRDDRAVAGDERGNTFQIEPVWGTELDRGNAGDLLCERADS
ncbi:MAG TPA: hypothetical protein VF933_03180 [Streptosporangiaceae bacterium]